MLRSHARRTFGSGLEQIIANTRNTSLPNVYMFRQRYPQWNKQTPDPILTDFYAAHFVKMWFQDVPSYNYWLQMGFGFTLAMCILSRQLLFNPDVYVRRQEVQKPLTDRHRQFSYSLPHLNSRWRNWASKHRRIWIDNEPDVWDNDACQIRAPRKQISKRYPFVFSITRYREEDPWYTTTSHQNISKLYRDIGYSSI